MTALSFTRLLVRALTALALASLLCTSSAPAQTPATATITGRVQNPTAKLTLENARITVAGTSRETFTDAFGEYRLTGLTPGSVTLSVFYTGLAPQSATFTVAAGSTTQRDFALTAADTRAASPSAGSALKLDEFVVSSARDTNASSIAINEQRFAANIKTVLATDSLGDVIQNNLGEFLKFLPGVDVETDQMNTTGIGLRGLPSAYTSIALDGDAVNTASGAGPARATSLQAFSLSNASRVEIFKVPTPDMSAASLGGSINMISRTAFEASRPEFRYKAYLNQNSREAGLGRKPGGGDGDDQARVFHYQPDFDFSYTVPISKTFGFSVNAVKNDQFGSARRINRTFNTATTPANNPLTASVDNPYLTSLVYNVFPVYEHRYAIGTRVDWRFAPTDTLSFSYSGGWLNQDYEQHNFTLNAGTNPISWGDNFTRGRPGSGAVSVNNTTRYVRVRNNVFRLNYRHIGQLWDVTGGVGYNFGDQTYRNTSHRQFENTSGRITGATVEFDGYTQFLPGKITVRNAAGDLVDPFKLDSYNFYLNGANTTRDNDSTARNARIDAKRKFYTNNLNFSLKAGASVTEEYRARRNGSFNPVYVGPDGIANNADDSFANTPSTLLNEAFLAYPGPRGLGPAPFASSRRAWELYEKFPQYFNTQTNRRTDIRTALTSPDQITERVDAAFIMGDIALFHNRLRFVGGIRFERTTDDGRAVLQDNNARYQKDAAGNLLLDAAKKPILIYPIASIDNTTPEGIANGIAEDALVYKRLGARLKKEYSGYYPSLNASYNITTNLLARAGVAKTLGRPDFANILGPTNAVQVDFDPNSNASGAALGTITAKNPALIPWTGQSLDLRLEYYTEAGGVLATGFYRKQIKNFFATRNFLATPEFLAGVGLGDEFVDYQVNAPSNVDGITHINGWEVDINTPLSALTPSPFARGIRVFANATLVTINSAGLADLRSFTPKNINWGLSYSRNPVTIFAKWTLVGKKRLGTVAAANLGAPGWNYQAERLRLDLSGDYQISRRLGTYFTIRNVFNDRDQNYAYALGSPRYVKFAAEGEYGVNFQLGLKGNF
jgi:iron complex outermembrane receptor protein